MPPEPLAQVGRWVRRRTWHWPAVMLPRLVRKHRRFIGTWPNLLRPRTFNEKLLLRMALDRRPVLQTFAGKYESRAYVIERLGGDALLPRLYAAVRDADELAGLDLPDRFIMKASHASGRYRVVTPERPLAAGEMAALVRQWLAVDYSEPQDEWAYAGAARIVVFEELLWSGGGLPWDQKAFCFDGRAVFFSVFKGRLEGRAVRSFFDRGWTRLPVQVHDTDADPDPPGPPACFEAMKQVADALSAGMDFLRVDMYVVDGALRVGELTNYPDALRMVFRPAYFDAVFGAPWRLPAWRVLRGRRTGPGPVS